MPASSVVALPFEKFAVLRLIAHAETSPGHLPSLDRPVPAPALWLVGDQGIYLMSNGAPAMPADGKTAQPRFVCYAGGCSVEDHADDWRPIHQAIRGGEDFCITVDRLEDVRDAVEQSNNHVVLVTDGAIWETYTESEFAAAYNRPASGMG